MTLKFPDNFATVFDDTEHQDAEANSIKNSNDGKKRGDFLVYRFFLYVPSASLLHRQSYSFSDWIWYVVIGCAIGLSIVVLLSFAVFSIKNC